ncbi:hypothetical protein ADUPG1_012362 [Aduncisulcus paluster]|uniref:N-acetyltransferase domain-containing protein n=1 Tax=Aduncisulcus paluster TaxID=2918883 RepID=A0ABQ5K2Y5_9EUKA|nr:hypothetical protein ADUPG1_012362 [Aduncisulcus paluster]|eukprot:gnl/Carplike_NY0171/3027_a4072_659.p1 GENE.gnl/Carplike_NY0171/3027_a4072_659~~gnl/Carplike_NY0171/3027_a4072_659.p1  ORF type:complete len:178 (+),score=19.53 gnl/Carplike_NY0171/3027_a4072_659:2-535(+)
MYERPFHVDDFFCFNNVNFDPLTETYHPAFYMPYLTRWGDICEIEESFGGDICGYMIAKAEGPGADRHGHVTAVSVAPEYRRLRIAKKLMENLENRTTNIYGGKFVDLFVRNSNSVARQFYHLLGYYDFHIVDDYYGDENGLDMRKEFSSGSKKKGKKKKTKHVSPEWYEQWAKNWK